MSHQIYIRQTPLIPQRCVTYHKNSLLASYPLHQSPQPSILRLPTQAISRCCPTNLPSNLRLFNDVDTRATGETKPIEDRGHDGLLAPLISIPLFALQQIRNIQRGSFGTRQSLAPVVAPTPALHVSPVGVGCRARIDSNLQGWKRFRASAKFLFFRHLWSIF